MNPSEIKDKDDLQRKSSPAKKTTVCSDPVSIVTTEVDETEVKSEIRDLSCTVNIKNDHPLPPSKKVLITGLLVQGNQTVGRDSIVTVNVSTPCGDSECPQKKLKTTVTTLLPCPLSDGLFTGRKKFLDELHQKFVMIREQEVDEKNLEFSRDPLKRMVGIVGLGGIGKSSCAIKYAENYKTFHQNVAWMIADSFNNLKNGFLDLARHFEICSDIIEKGSRVLEDGTAGTLTLADVKSLVSQVYRHFSAHVEKGLFIFDNAIQMHTTSTPTTSVTWMEQQLGGGEDSGFGVQDFLPSESLQNCPMFLFTSRNKSWGLPGNKIQTLNLESMVTSEVLLFLKKVWDIDQVDFEDASLDEETQMFYESVKKCLIDLGDSLLGGYPLALRLASASIATQLELLDCRDNLREYLEAVKTEIGVYRAQFDKDWEQWTNYKTPANVLERYDQIMDTVWRGTVSKIKKLGEQDEVCQMAIAMLNIIAFLPTAQITVELCHLIYHDVTIDDEEKHKLIVTSLEATVRRSKERKAFGILEKFSMVSILTFHDRVNDKKSKDFILEFLTNPLHVQVHRLVQKWTRINLEKANDLQSLLQVAHFFMDFCILFDSANTFINGYLMEHSWPDNFYQKSILISCSRRYKLSVEKVKQIYHLFLTRRPHLQVEDEEYFLLVKTLVIIYNYWHDIIESPDKRDTWTIDDELDNSQLFHETDFLYKIQLKQFLHWTLHQAIDRYNEHHLWYDLLGRILYQIVVQSGTILTDDLKGKTISWIILYNQRMIQVAQKFVPRGSSFYTVFRIANKLWSPQKSIEMAVRTAEVFEKYQHNDQTTWTQLHNMMYMEQWPKDVWKNYQIYEAGRRDEALKISTTFLDIGGLHLVAKELSLMARFCDSQDNRRSLGLLNAFDLLQPPSYFLPCAEKMVGSSCFMKALQDVFKSAPTQIDKRYWTYAIPFDVVFSWFALLIHVGSNDNYFPPKMYYEEQMTQFHHRITIGMTDEIIRLRGFPSHFRIKERRYKEILKRFWTTHNVQPNHDERIAGICFPLASTLKQIGGWNFEQN